MNPDHELPAGFQDADFEARELTEAANREARLRRKGICTHGWIGPVEIGKPARKCHHCGRVFASEEELNDDRREALI